MQLEAIPAPTKQFALNRYIPGRLVKVTVVIILMLGMAAGYSLSGTPVPLTVNGAAFSVRAHQLDVDAVLSQSGITLRPEDELLPALNSPLSPGQPIEITLARPVVVDMGEIGHLHPQTIYTLEQTPQKIYEALGVALVEADDVYVGEVLWAHDRPVPTVLPALPPTAVSLRARVTALRPEPVRLVLHQAIPVHVVEGDRRLTFMTTRQTVGDVLVARNIPLYVGDAITPNLSEPLSADTTISIKRSIPATIYADGGELRTRTLHKTVGQVLAQEGVMLVGQDYAVPAIAEPLDPVVPIEVVRVVERLEIEKETTPFETIWRPDELVELDTQEIRQEGQEGVTKMRTRVRYENGEEAWRAEEDTWLEQEAADKLIAYGTKVVIRTLETPDGEIEYWRKIRMLATSYSAATSGKSKDHPAYGITRSGLQAGYGIVAVDPTVVDLLSEVYVPGYGQAIAGDTGGKILGKHVDLGFDEDAPPLWYKWVDIYLLTPAPPWFEIRYVLPQWPQEPR